MNLKKKLLVATSNQGKFKEISHFLRDGSFEILSLKDLNMNIPEPEESEKSLGGNALLKARYYSEKTGLISLADDGGLFIDALGGWPGIKSARIAKTKEDRIEVVLCKLKEEKNRNASFKAVLTVFDPNLRINFSAYGELPGKILEKPLKKGDNKWGYNTIFFVEKIKKTYGELTIKEKNAISHRSKALAKIKKYLERFYL